MIALTCLCGSVRVSTDRRPDFLHDCNCTLCTKTGALWGYFDPSQIRVDGETAGFVRSDKADAGAEIRFCPTCGSTTHFVLTPTTIARFGNTMCGVNMRLADAHDLSGVEVRYPDGRNWSGAGEFGFVRPSTVIGG